MSSPLMVKIMKTNNGFPCDKEKGIGYYEDTWLPVSAEVSEQLADLGEGRLRLMDLCGIDYARVSPDTPKSLFDVETSKRVAKDLNITVAAAIAKHPNRFGAFVTLAPKDPE